MVETSQLMIFVSGLQQIVTYLTCPIFPTIRNHWGNISILRRLTVLSSTGNKDRGRMDTYLENISTKFSWFSLSYSNIGCWV